MSHRFWILALTLTAAGAQAAENVGATPTAPVVAFSRTFYVSPAGRDSGAGSAADPFKTVQRGVNALQPGDGLLVRAGNYPERVTIAAGTAQGAAGAPITLRVAPGERATLVGGNGLKTPLLTLSRAYWRVEGLSVNVGGDRAPAVMIRGQDAHHVTLAGGEFQNGTAGGGVIVADYASEVNIEGNNIHHFQQVGIDSHGVVLTTTSRAVTVRNNDIHENSGDGVQCTGPENGDTLPGTPLDSLLVVGNRLHDNYENGADIKTCTRVTLRANQVYGHHPRPSSAGEGMIVHMSAKDVVVEDNLLWGNSVAIVIGGVRVGNLPSDIVVRRNRVWGSVDAGYGLRVNAAERVKLYNNTISGLAGMGIIIGSAENGPSKQVEVKNNIVSDCALVARVGPTYEGVSFERNLFFNTGRAVTLRLMGGPNLNLATWRTKTGWDRASLELAPSFLNAPAADFGLATASPARNVGLDVGLSFCGAGPDLGALEAPCL